MGRKIILVIDDDAGTIANLEELLENSFNVLIISYGARAIEFLQKSKVDLVILSQYTPDMNGLKILHSIHTSVPSLPVIFIAEMATTDLVISAFRAGAKDFYTKPFNTSDLVKCINELIGPELNENLVITQSKVNDVNSARKMPASDLISTDSRATTFDVGHKRLFKSFFQSMRAGLDQLNNRLNFQNLKFLHLFQRKENKRSIEDLIKASQELTLTPQSTELITNTNSISLKETAKTLEAYFLGKFHIFIDNKEINDWQGKKTREIMAYITYYHTRRIYRDILMDKFWPHSSPDCARNCLNVTLHNLRLLFQKNDPSFDYIIFKEECYFLHPDVEVKSDVKEFQHNWRIAQSTERDKGLQASLSYYELASALYKGDFMEEDIYASWTELERENLREIYLVVLDKLSHFYSLDGKPETAIDLCNTILKKDNCREEVHRRLMQCYYRLGEKAKAIKQFNKCKIILKNELEIVPSDVTITLYNKIKNY